MVNPTGEVGADQIKLEKGQIPSVQRQTGSWRRRRGSGGHSEIPEFKLRLESEAQVSSA